MQKKQLQTMDQANILSDFISDLEERIYILENEINNVHLLIKQLSPEYPETLN
jgi:hypothetical protein